MEKQPQLDLISGGEALEQLRQFKAPVHTGILHIPNQLTWPMIVPQGGLNLSLEKEVEANLTYGLVTSLIAFEETFHLIGRVDYAYKEQEQTRLFRLDWQYDRDMIETIAELGIVVMSEEKPAVKATREELVAFLQDSPTFVCEIDAMELHRLRIQVIRMQAQEQLK
jgi:hypothetical protein